MSENNSQLETEDSKAASNRKNQHIALALQSQVNNNSIDQRFYYEPLLNSHNLKNIGVNFLRKQLHAPIWISSMTGGSEKAKIINQRLAKACKEFGFGMGLGSCRMLLKDKERFEDFNLRPIIGNDLPLYANLGIFQIEKAVRLQQTDLIEKLVNDLQADGLFIHINPMQEWLQPEGEHFTQSPIETIQQFIEQTNINVVVKEVGQGFGPESLKQLLNLPIQGIEFAANGGTNFALLELLRSNEAKQNAFSKLATIGHSAQEMVVFTNELLAKGIGKDKDFIISGGVKNFLDGYHLRSNFNGNSVYGQASKFLEQAQISYEALQNYCKTQVEGYQLATNFLKSRPL